MKDDRDKNEIQGFYTLVSVRVPHDKEKENDKMDMEERNPRLIQNITELKAFFSGIEIKSLNGIFSFFTFGERII